MRRLFLVGVALLAGCNSTSSPQSATTDHSRTAQSASAAHRTAASAAHPPRIVARTLFRLPTGVSRTVAVANGSRVLVLGGLAPGDSTTGRVWSVDVANRTARAAGALTTPVHDACGALVAGKALVFGGGAATTVSAVQQWQSTRSRRVASLPQPRSDSSSAVLGATAYVVGGFDGHRMVTDVLATNDGVHFRVVAHLRQGVRYAAVAATGHWLLVIGGALATTEGTATGAQSDLIQRVDVRTGRVDVAGHLPRPLAHATAVTLGGLVLVVGGRHGTTASRDISWVSGAGFQRNVGLLPHALSDAAVAVVGDTAVVVGGETSGPGAPTDTVTSLRLAA